MGIIGNHDITLMTLSFLISCFASYTALDIADRVNKSKNWTKYGWLLLSSISMGGGIWAMHFVAMLAFNSPLIAGYNIELTVYSLLIAIFGTFIGFLIVSYNTSYYAILMSGIIMGLAVALMHYVGMAAMYLAATLSYTYFWAGISILVAIGAATSAMWLAYNTITVNQKLLASLVMGIAISGMHYTAMEACSFAPHDLNFSADASIYQTNLAIAISFVVGFILLSGLLVSIFDRRFAFLAQQEAQQLIENEKKYRDLFRETPLPIHTVNHTGIVQDVSNSWLQLLGYKRVDVIGQMITKFMNDDSAIMYETRINSFTPSHLNEYQFITKANKNVDVLLSSSLQRRDDGAFIGAQEGLVDITNRKVAETALRQKQKMEALGELVGGISHDFNNLLMIISGTLDIIVAHPETFEKRILTIQDTVKRGQQLTRRLLTFSHKDTGVKSFIDLRLFLNDMKEMLERTLGNSIQVNIDVKSDIYLIQVNQDELELTIVNLCVNARDAIQGRGFITIQAVNEYLPNNQVSNLKGQFVKLSVIDNGTGIDKEYINKVFEPFFTTKNKGLGTGLGLTQVYGFATIQCGGTVHISSKLGSGTSISLYIPTVTSSYEEVILPSISSKFVNGEGKKVLIVEDDEIVADVIENLFKQLNFKILSARNAQQALNILETKSVFAVFTDIQMPGDIDGIFLANKIREQYKGVFIALITGYSEPSDAIIETSFPILKKPFTISSLQSFIKIALD